MGMFAGAWLGVAALLAGGQEVTGSSQFWPQQRVTFQQDVTTRRADCQRGGGTLVVALEAERRHDFNGDGVNDIVDNSNGYYCMSGDAAEYGGPVDCSASGCALTVYLSGPGGHRAAWRWANISSWRVVPGAVPRIVATAALCDNRGGYVDCGIEAAWDGRAIATRRTGTTRRTGNGEPFTARWVVRTDARNVPIAMTTAFEAPLQQQFEALRGMSLRCNGGAPWLHMIPHLRATALDRVEFEAGGQRVAVVLERLRDGTWGGAVRDPALVALLAGRANRATVRVGGRALAEVPLGGSTRALGEALAGCASGA